MTQDEVEEVLELGDPTADVGVAHSSDVSYPQKKNKKGWKITKRS